MTVMRPQKAASVAAFMGVVPQIRRMTAVVRMVRYCDFWPRGNKVASGAD